MLVPEDEAAAGPVLRSPLARISVGVSTAVASLAAPPFAIGILAVVLAWVSVRGLERSGNGRRAPGGRRKVRRTARRRV